MSEEIKPTNQSEPSPEETKSAPKLEPKPMNRDQIETLRNKLQKKYH